MSRQAGRYKTTVTTAADLYEKPNIKKPNLNHGRLLRLLLETLEADKIKFLAYT